MRNVISIVVCLTAIVCWTSAGAVEDKNVIRFGAVYVSPTGDLSGDDSFSEDLGDGTTLAFEGSLTLEPQSSTTLFVGYERRFTDRLGLEVSAWSASHDVDGRLRGTAWLLDSGSGMLIDTASIDFTERFGKVRITPVSAGLNVHLTPASAVDLFVGPFVSYVLYDDLEVEGGESIAVDDDFGIGAVIGIDVPLGAGRWTFTGAGRYLDTKASPKDMGPGDEALDVKPWNVQLSVGAKF